MFLPNSIMLDAPIQCVPSFSGEYNCHTPLSVSDPHPRQWHQGDLLLAFVLVPLVPPLSPFGGIVWCESRVITSFSVWALCSCCHFLPHFLHNLESWVWRFMGKISYLLTLHHHRMPQFWWHLHISRCTHNPRNAIPAFCQAHCSVKQVDSLSSK